MQYKQKLVKIGNSVGIILPKKVLKALKLDASSKVYVENVNETLIIKKDQSKAVSPEFLKIAEKVGKKYSKAFKELASK